MKALEIYTQDIADREQGDALPRQQYYAALRDALHRELMQQGFSDLLEKLLLELRGGEMEKIYVLDYAALMECHSMIVLGRGMRDAEEYVPHLNMRGERARWSSLEQAGSLLMTVTREMTDMLRQLRSVSRQLVDARDDTVIPQADDAAKREIEQVHLLNKMLDDRCRALQQERDELHARLRQLEDGVISEKVRYAIEARRLQEEEALRQTYAARQESARAAYRAQYAEELASAHAQQEDAARQTAALREEAAAEYAAVRRDMGGDLRQLLTLVQGQIDRWEQRLDAAEGRMLAQCYAALHGLYTEDVTRLVLDAQCGSAPEELAGGLAALQTGMRSRLQQLEQAMLRLGLTVIRPAAGDDFDGAVHMPTGTSAGAVGGTKVARCVRPGVTVSGSQDVLLKAEVELE